MSDLIAAVATPASPSAIGIIRLSGPGAAAAVDRVFRAAGGTAMACAEPRKLILGTLLDRTGTPIDQVLATVSFGPNSYTGEDTAELQCHGAPTVLAMALDALCAAGARPARPGEFTQRAFLNGRLDLMQAEAVADLLDARTGEAVRTAAGQLEGALSRRVEEVYGVLVDLMAHFHAVLDYPDEDIDPFRAEELEQALQTAAEGLERLLESYGRGRFLARGIPCVLLGKPNVGKSSLLNALLGYERAIVTDVPGTTRDTVEEALRLGETLLRLVDTAGLRAGGDEAERLGIARSRAAAEGAELALVLLDPTRPMTEEDGEALSLSLRAGKRIVVLTKADLCREEDCKAFAPYGPVRVSAVTGAGLGELEEAIQAAFPRARQEEAGAMLTNARQEEACSRALEALRAARDGLEGGITPDAVLTDVEGAMAALGELTGRTVREDVVERIFSRFCVGK